MAKKKTYDIFRVFDGKTTTIHLDCIVGIRRHNEYMCMSNPRYSVYTDLNHFAGYALVPTTDGDYDISYIDSTEILGVLDYLGKMTTTTVENLFNDYTRKGDTFHYQNGTISTQMVLDKVIKTVKPHGNSCGVLVPKSWEGKRVMVIIEDLTKRPPEEQDSE